MGKPFYEILTLIGERKKEAVKEIAAIDEHLQNLATTWYQELTVLQRILEDRNAELSVFSKFGQTEYTFVIMGWVPKKYIQKTKKALADTFGARVIVNEIDVTADKMDAAPTFYDNPWFVKPFESLIQLISPPKYREVDPSPLIAIFFPIFFGLMVGDIAYGLIILAFATVIKRKYRTYEWLQVPDEYPGHLVNSEHLLWLPVRGILREFRGDDGLDPPDDLPGHHVEPH